MRLPFPSKTILLSESETSPPPPPPPSDRFRLDPISKTATFLVSTNKATLFELANVNVWRPRAALSFYIRFKNYNQDRAKLKDNKELF